MDSNNASAAPFSNVSSDEILDPLRKAQIRIENEKYLRNHPELDGLINKFLMNILETKPNDVQQFAIDFFVNQNNSGNSNDNNSLQQQEQQ